MMVGMIIVMIIEMVMAMMLTVWTIVIISRQWRELCRGAFIFLEAPDAMSL